MKSEKHFPIGNNNSWIVNGFKGARNEIKENIELAHAQLTDNVQIQRVTFNWLWRDLTIVAAGVAFLDPLDLQRPFIRRPMMCCLEAKISRVGVSAYGEDVQIPTANPWNLKSSGNRKKRWKIETWK